MPISSGISACTLAFVICFWIARENSYICTNPPINWKCRKHFALHLKPLYLHRGEGWISTRRRGEGESLSDFAEKASVGGQKVKKRDEKGLVVLTAPLVCEQQKIRRLVYCFLNYLALPLLWFMLKVETRVRAFVRGSSLNVICKELCHIFRQTCFDVHMRWRISIGNLSWKQTPFQF